LLNDCPDPGKAMTLGPSGGKLAQAASATTNKGAKRRGEGMAELIKGFRRPGSKGWAIVTVTQSPLAR